MPRNNASSSVVAAVSETATTNDAGRRRKVEKLLVSLAEAGLPIRDARLALNNTMLNVPAKGGLVRVDLSRADPGDVLLRMFDAVWKAGMEAGAKQERDAQAETILTAFPSLRDTFERIADERIDADRARRANPEE